MAGATFPMTFVDFSFYITDELRKIQRRKNSQLDWDYNGRLILNLSIYTDLRDRYLTAKFYVVKRGDPYNATPETAEWTAQEVKIANEAHLEYALQTCNWFLSEVGVAQLKHKTKKQ
jgi:hypothetical protein